jgi:hypothetical protein
VEQQALRIRTETLKIFGGRPLLTFFIALALFEVRFTEASESRQWSFDISPYGLQQANGEKNPDRFPETRLAVTPHGAFEMPWDVSLLVVDSHKGNLLVNLGPWKSDFHFELHTTAWGTFSSTFHTIVVPRGTARHYV